MIKEGFVCICVTSDRMLHSSERYPWRVWGNEKIEESWRSAKIFETDEEAKNFLREKEKTHYGLHIIVPAIFLH